MSRPGKRRSDAGTTLIEVMAAVGLFSILGFALVSISILALNTSTNLGIRLDNVTQGQIGANAVSKILRTAVLPDQLADQVCVNCADTAIVQATRSQVSFYANLNNTGSGPSLVTLRVIADPHRPGRAMLQQHMQPPTVLSGGRYTFCNPATPGCAVQVRTLARGLYLPIENVFGYYDFDGNAITSPTLTDSDLARVSSVDVVLRVQTVPVRDENPPNTVVLRVRLPNADINVLARPEA